MSPVSPNAWILRFISLTLMGVMVAVTATAQQSGKQTVLPVRIDPPEATLYVGESLRFAALAGGAKNAAVKWSIQEPEGGRITDVGVYTAPRAIGIYHVVASSNTNPHAKATATVTVVVHYDVPQPQ